MKSAPTISIRGYTMILLSSILFGSYGVWSKLMGNEFGVFYQGWVRSVLVLLVLIPLVFITRSYQKIDRSDWKWLAITCLFGIATQAPLYYAFNHTSIGTATLLFYAMFIVTSYVVGRLFLGEKVTRIKLLAMLLAFGGLALVFGISLAKFSLLGLVLAGVNGVASGGEVSTTKKSTHKYSSLLVTTYVWLGILGTHLPLSLVTHEKQWVPANTPQWWAMLAYAFAGMVAFWLVVEGFRFVDASIGSLIGLLEIIWGVLFGVWFFHEKVGLSTAFGGLLILVAGMLPDLTNLLEHKRASQPAEPAREL